MKRRNFIRQTAMGAGAILGLPHVAFQMKPRYKLGLQLYTIRDALAADPRGSLEEVQAMGFEDLEIYGLDAKAGTIYGYTLREFKRLLDGLGLTVSSGHYGFADFFEASEGELMWFVDSCIEAAQILNSAYITWPLVHPGHRNPEDFRRLADKMNFIGELVHSAGLCFAYHNHGYEFEDWGGEKGYDILLERTEHKLVKFQMDMYWVVHSGQTPAGLVERDPGRFVMWHIKDMDKITRDYTELGNGSIDYTRILPDPMRSGLEYYYLEQGGNFAHSSMESVRTSLRYFRRRLQQFV